MKILFSSPLGLVHFNSSAVNQYVQLTGGMCDLIEQQNVAGVVGVLEQMKINPLYYREVVMHFAVAFSMSRLFMDAPSLNAESVRKIIKGLPKENTIRSNRERERPVGSSAKGEVQQVFFEAQITPIGEGNRWLRKAIGSDQIRRDTDDMNTPGPPLQVAPRRKQVRIFRTKAEE